jgi:hypothetical protein
MDQKYLIWKKSFAYVGKGVTEGTMEDALNHLFYDGLSPWLQSFGYKWSTNELEISQKFLKLCYLIYCTLPMDPRYMLQAPEPLHRNLPEDRETFDYFIDSYSFAEFLEQWSFRDEIIGTRFDNLILDFCYVWLDPTSGHPGTWTQNILNANNEDASDEDYTALPDGNWSRRKHDLY